MCAIIGYKPLEPHTDTVDAFRRLFEQSVIRGRHAYGIAWPQDTVACVRALDPAVIPVAFNPAYPTIAHTRYSTSGDWETMSNNQPIVVDNMALAMNGVISMATKEEFETEFGLTCDTENDAELFLRHIRSSQTEEDMWADASAFLMTLTGSFAGVWLWRDGQLYAGRNERRPMWTCTAFGGTWFASTRDIFLRAEFPTEHVRPADVGVYRA